MLSKFKIPRNLISSNLYLYQKQLLTSLSNNDNSNSNNNENKSEAKNRIDETGKNILNLFSSKQSSPSLSPLSQEPLLSQDKEGISFPLSLTTSPFKSHFPLPNSEIAKLLSDFLVPSEENYIFHIHASYNNTLVTLTNSHGNILITRSGGSVGFKKSQRGGYEAAHQAAASVVQKIKEKGLNIKNVEICIKGFGPGRDAAFKALANVENKWNVKRITDTTPLPFNGCRPRKARRL